MFRYCLLAFAGFRLDWDFDSTDFDSTGFDSPDTLASCFRSSGALLLLKLVFQLECMRRRLSYCLLSLGLSSASPLLWRIHLPISS